MKPPTGWLLAGADFRYASEVAAEITNLDPTRADVPLQLVFRGECLDGYDPGVVRQAVARALRLDEARTERLFSGKPVVLRRKVDAVRADRHIARFATLGAVLRAEPSKPTSRRPEPLPSRGPASRTARAPWWGPQKWGRLRAICIVLAVILGVAMGPALKALWQETSTSNAAMSQDSADATRSSPLAQAPADMSPTAPMPERSPDPATDGEIPEDMTTEALREYRQGYLLARNHKAFAISSRSTHAWIAGAGSQNEARERAVASCMESVQPVGGSCRVVDADGAWED